MSIKKYNDFLKSNIKLNNLVSEFLDDSDLDNSFHYISNSGDEIKIISGIKGMRGRKRVSDTREHSYWLDMGNNLINKLEKYDFYFKIDNSTPHSLSLKIISNLD